MNMKVNKERSLWKGLSILLLCAMILSLLLIGASVDPDTVLAQSSPSFAVTANYSSQQGSPGMTITYVLTVENLTGELVEYSIVCGSPYTTCDQPSPMQIDANGFKNINVSIILPSNALNGEEYTSLVRVSNGTETIDTSLKTTVTVTATASPFKRPLLVIESYSAGDTAITPGNDFTLTMTLKNTGSSLAGNVIASFVSTDFKPLDTGGVRAVAELGAGKAVTISQPMRANYSLWGYDSGAIQVNLSYTDINGTAYSETFNITINLKVPNYTAPTPTPTPGAASSAQLVVENYTADVDPLQPGAIFNLNLSIHNLGLESAKKVTMVLGGGVENIQPGEDGSSGTNGGGMAGGGADLTHFAPLGTSNLIYLDSIESGGIVEPMVQLIVNVTTTPGAYPFKISFVYEDAEGKRVVDDQVITLLVYSLPKVEFSFYRDPGILFAGQPGMLPLQITNLGKTTAVLGNMVVTADGVEITENIIMVGSLEPGGYFTMDSTAWPMVEGPLDLRLSVTYTDDFNQVRTVEQTLSVIVEPMPVYEEPTDMGEMPVDDFSQPETFVQKVWRFIKGLLGLGSGTTSPEVPVYEEPMEEIPVIPGGKG